MEKFSYEDKEFLDGVWRKVRRLEFEQIQAEIVKENKRRLLVKELKLGLFLVMLVLVIVIPLFIIDKGNAFSVITAGFIFMGAGIIHEYLIDMESKGRAIYEYRN